MANRTNNTSRSFKCAAANRTFNLDADPILFRNTIAIERVHSDAVRWGRSSNIDQLISGTQQEGKEYLIGVLGTSFALFSFFVLWIGILLVLKYLGYELVGLFSGSLERKAKPQRPQQPPVQNDDVYVDDIPAKEQPIGDSKEPCQLELENVKCTEKELPLQQQEQRQEEVKASAVFNVLQESSALPSEAQLNAEGHREESTETSVAAKWNDANDTRNDDEDTDCQKQLQKWEDELAVSERRLRRVRITVLFCGLDIIVCVILMLVKGANGLVKTADDAIQGLQQAQNLAQGGIDLIDEYLTVQKETSKSIREFSTSANRVCPYVREQLCLNLTDSASGDCNFTDIPLSETIRSFFDSKNSYIYDELQDTRSDLEFIMTTFEDWEQTAQNFNWAFYVAAAFGAALALVNLIVVYGVILAWRKKSAGNWWLRLRSFLRHWLFVPVFAFLVIMTWIFSMVFITGSISSADLCYDSPDPHLVSVLQENEDKFSGSLIDEFAIFYIGGCPDTGPLGLRNQVETIVGLGRKVHNIAVQIANADAEAFQDKCGTDPTPVNVAGFGVAGTLCLLGDTMLSVQNYFSCENWRRVYRTVMYEAVCDTGNQAFYWVSITQFVIVLLAMIMLTLRVAFSEIDIPPEDSELD